MDVEHYYIVNRKAYPLLKLIGVVSSNSTIRVIHTYFDKYLLHFHPSFFDFCVELQDCIKYEFIKCINDELYSVDIGWIQVNIVILS